MHTLSFTTNIQDGYVKYNRKEIHCDNNNDTILVYFQIPKNAMHDKC